MNVRRLVRLLELALVLVAVSLLARWGLQWGDRLPEVASPAPTPSAWSSPPLVLAGVWLEQGEAAVLETLGEPTERSRLGAFQTLEYRTPGQEGMVVVVLDQDGRVLSIMAEQHPLLLGETVLIRPGDPPEVVERLFGPPSQRTPDSWTWRQVPREAGQEVAFGELTVHLQQARVSQVVLVRNMLAGPP